MKRRARSVSSSLRILSITRYFHFSVDSPVFTSLRDPSGSRVPFTTSESRFWGPILSKIPIRIGGRRLDRFGSKIFVAKRRKSGVRVQWPQAKTVAHFLNRARDAGSSHVRLRKRRLKAGVDGLSPEGTGWPCQAPITRTWPHLSVRA